MLSHVITQTNMLHLYYNSQCQHSGYPFIHPSPFSLPSQINSAIKCVFLHLMFGINRSPWLGSDAASLRCKSACCPYPCMCLSVAVLVQGFLDCCSFDLWVSLLNVAFSHSFCLWGLRLGPLPSDTVRTSVFLGGQRYQISYRPDEFVLCTFRIRRKSPFSLSEPT